MNSVLQDILGLIKRRKVKTPTDKDYIISAAYDNPQEALKPNPKMHPSLISIAGLKKYFIQAIKSAYVGGWARYDDKEYTELDPFTVIEDATPVVLPNNAGFSIETSMHDIKPFYDPASEKIQINKLNSAYTMVVTFKASTGNVEQAHLDLSLTGGGSTPYERVSQTLSFTKGNNETQNFYMMFKYYGDADFVANGNQWLVSAVGEDVKIWDVIYYIEKTYV